MAEDDIDFKQAMQGVRRLRKTSTHPVHHKTVKKKVPRTRTQTLPNYSSASSDQEINSYRPEDALGQSNETGAEHLFFLRQGQQKKVLRDLKRGKRYVMEMVVDLHGLTQIKAQASINQAIVELPVNTLSCILVIHGKGLRSAQGPVLKEFTARYLKTLPEVKAYCSAQTCDGGTGALYVLLRP